MKEQEIIDALKSNKFKFGDLSSEMQEAFKALKPEDLEYTSGWRPITNNTYEIAGSDTLRLRPDYEAPKPEIADIPVTKDVGGLYCYRRRADVPFVGLFLAPSDPDFIGFKYEGSEKARPMARRYKDPKDGTEWSFWKPGFEVLTPTHVLFRSKP